MRKRSQRSSRPVVGACLIAAGVAGATGAWLSASAPKVPQTGVPMTVRGVVSGTLFTPPSEGVRSTTVPSHYQGARICADLNNNAVCDADEAVAMSDKNGSFVLHSNGQGPIIAEILDSSTNTTSDGTGNNRDKNPQKTTGAVVNVFRAAFGQIAEGAAGQNDGAPLSADVVVSPLSTEVVRMMEADNLEYWQAKLNLATRLTVPVDQVLRDLDQAAGSASPAGLLSESNILTGRFALAAKMVGRHDVSPAALAKNPKATDPLTMTEAQQVAMNLEGIPRYDHVFVIMLENKATSSIKNSPFAPKINAYLNSGNQFTSYFANGNPSEPNRMAVTAADDFGVTDDNSYTCVPAGDTADAVEDLPLPAGVSPCTQSTNHNIKNKPNLFSALSAAGMTWRVYSESVTPGRDWRLDGARDETILAPDHVYAAGSPVGAIGTKGLMLRRPMLYVTKHNASVAFQAVRSSPEFARSNRTMGGGQWDAAMDAVGEFDAHLARQHDKRLPPTAANFVIFHVLGPTLLAAAV